MFMTNPYNPGKYRKAAKALWALTIALLIAATVSEQLIVAVWGLATSAAAAAASVNAATKRAVQENRREIELAYKHGRQMTMREVA